MKQIILIIFMLHITMTCDITASDTFPCGQCQYSSCDQQGDTTMIGHMQLCNMGTACCEITKYDSSLTNYHYKVNICLCKWCNMNYSPVTNIVCVNREEFFMSRLLNKLRRLYQPQALNDPFFNQLNINQLNTPSNSSQSTWLLEP